MWISELLLRKFIKYFTIKDNVSGCYILTKMYLILQEETGQRALRTFRSIKVTHRRQ
jgi:hypothetical protein